MSCENNNITEQRCVRISYNIILCSHCRFLRTQRPIRKCVCECGPAPHSHHTIAHSCRFHIVHFKFVGKFRCFHLSSSAPVAVAVAATTSTTAPSNKIWNAAIERYFALHNVLRRRDMTIRQTTYAWYGQHILIHRVTHVPDTRARDTPLEYRETVYSAEHEFIISIYFAAADSIA